MEPPYSNKAKRYLSFCRKFSVYELDALALYKQDAIWQHVWAQRFIWSILITWLAWETLRHSMQFVLRIRSKKSLWADSFFHLVVNLAISLVIRIGPHLIFLFLCALLRSNKILCHHTGQKRLTMGRKVDSWRKLSSDSSSLSYYWYGYITKTLRTSLHSRSTLYPSKSNFDIVSKSIGTVALQERSWATYSLWRCHCFIVPSV